MGFWSAVCSCVGSICSGVASFCSSVLPRISAAISTISSAVCQVAKALFGSFDIYKPEDKIDDMGDRAMQASKHGITPEKFDKWDDYTNAIRNFKLDPAETAKTSIVEKNGAGIAIGTLGLEKKLNAPEGSLGAMWILAAAKPEYFTADRLSDLLKAGARIENIVKYFDGKLGASDAVSVRDSLMADEKKRFPDKTSDAIYTEITDAKNAMRNLE